MHIDSCDQCATEECFRAVEGNGFRCLGCQTANRFCTWNRSAEYFLAIAKVIYNEPAIRFGEGKNFP